MARAAGFVTGGGTLGFTVRYCHRPRLHGHLTQYL